VAAAETSPSSSMMRRTSTPNAAARGVPE
jgi:hypothetical protein